MINPLLFVGIVGFAVGVAFLDDSVVFASGLMFWGGLFIMLGVIFQYRGEKHDDE